MVNILDINEWLQTYGWIFLLMFIILKVSFWLFILYCIGKLSGVL